MCGGLFGALACDGLFGLSSPFQTGIPFSPLLFIPAPLHSWGYKGLGGIAASWVISPLFSGAIGVLLYKATDRWVISAERPREAALASLPVLFAATAFFMVVMVVSKSSVAAVSSSEAPGEGLGRVMGTVSDWP